MTLVVHGASYLVKRSEVATEGHYSEYEDPLRHDFWYSCAYCTVAEAEALGFGFEIEHYVPVSSNSALEHVYSNLMWSCALCNDKKGSWNPPPSAAALGFVFFRADQHEPIEHFELKDLRIEGRTNIGRFSEKVLNLNRLALLRVRKIRRELYATDLALQAGLRALVDMPIQIFPTETRKRVAKYAERLKRRAVRVDEVVSDEIARALSASPLLERDANEDAQTRGRRAYLREMQALFPEPWTARRRASEDQSK